MTVGELMKVLQIAVDDGASDAEVLFDAEARSFCVHMVTLRDAHYEKDAMEFPYVSLNYDWQGQVKRE